MPRRVACMLIPTPFVGLSVPIALSPALPSSASSSSVFALMRRLVRPSRVRCPLHLTRADAVACLGDGHTAVLPEAVVDAITAERRRLALGSEASASVAGRSPDPGETWISWLQALPWTGSAPPPSRPDVAAALDRSHAALGGVKTAIVDHACASVRHGSTLCLVGPPGVGKTSLAQALGDATGRPLARISCGAWRDESDIRGHNRTWRASQPGAILRELRRVRCRWPVFVLDEVDKLGPEAAAVLLEVLDPVQSATFRDAYVEVPFDLAGVLFVATANNAAAIPPALRDRLELVSVPAYSVADKVAIAADKLLPTALEATGARLELSPAACEGLVRHYTREPGVRALERVVLRLCDRVARAASPRPVVVEPAGLAAWLGEPPALFDDEPAARAKAVADADLPAAGQREAYRLLEAIDGRSAFPYDRPVALVKLDVLLNTAWPGCGPALSPARGRKPASLFPAEVARRVQSRVVGHRSAVAALLPSLCSRRGGASLPAVVLEGPAGTGKTLLAVLALEAAGYDAAVIDCGGLLSVDHLVGDDREGPGAILKGLRRRSHRPVGLVLDDVDRLDLASVTKALRAVLSAREGVASPFLDCWLRVPIALESVPIVATARRLEGMSDAFRSAFRVVALHGYDDELKLRIARRYLWPACIELHHVGRRRSAFDEPVVRALVSQSRAEGGVSGLSGRIASWCSRLNSDASPATPLVALPSAPAAGGVGRTLALFVGPAGGHAALLEVATSPGRGSLVLTGSQRRLFRESVRTARQWLVSHGAQLGLPPGWHASLDVHVHVGRMAVRKSGSSAGLALVAALASALSSRPLPGGVALTGEVGLDDEVRPVGGLPEKAIAAGRAGVVCLYVPAVNRPELELTALPPLPDGLRVVYASSVGATLRQLLGFPEPSESAASRS